MPDRMTKTITPQRQASERAGNGGIVPPADHRWLPGQSGNPGGAPVGQVYPGRWFGPLSELPVAEVRQIVGDESASASKRAAARLILDAVDGERPDDRRRALAEIMNRTEGKPGQSINLTHHNGELERVERQIKDMPPDKLQKLMEMARELGLGT